MLPRVTVIDGIDAKYIVMPNDDISRIVFTHGNYDPITTYIASLFCDLHENPCVIDIGANIGTFTVPIAQKLLGKGHVLSFEPQQTTFYQLCGNLVLNRLDNVTAHETALSDTDNLVKFSHIDYENNRNNGGLSIDGTYNKLQNIIVDQSRNSTIRPITLDSVAVDKSVAVIKIDVEGFERKVILGGREFLRFHNYPPLLFEAWRYEWFTDERKALLDLVDQDLGYELFEYDQGLGNFVAQHPENPYYFKFKVDGGQISWTRVR